MAVQLARSNLPPRARHNNRGGTPFDRRRPQNRDRWPDTFWRVLGLDSSRPVARYDVGTELWTADGRRVIASLVWRSWYHTPHWLYIDNKGKSYREADIALLLCSPWFVEHEEKRVGWLFEVGYELHFGSVTGRLVEARNWMGTSYVFHFDHGFGHRVISEDRLLQLHLLMSGQPPGGGTSAERAGPLLLLPPPRERGRVNGAKTVEVIYLFPSQTTQTPHEAALVGNDAERTAPAAPLQESLYHE